MIAADLTGQQFGRLLVVVRGTNASHRKVRWWCLCDCGQVVLVRADGLLRQRTRSCGCLRSELSGARGSAQLRRHGHAGDRETPTYVTWRSMMERCRNANASNYHKYGGRGVAVCDRWLSFENFLADMGERPGGTTLDRIDSDGNYEPSNCRWATPLEQRHNRRVAA